LYKPLFYIIFLLTFQFSFAQQNLVYNGDFEIYDTCPINVSYPSDLQIEHCLGWTAPTKLGTSDYYNVCNTTPASAGVPSNIAGYQQPYSGYGYCGFIAWDIDFGVDYREYIQTKLTEHLKPQHEYQISFYVSEAIGNYALRKIGALFSSSSLSSNTSTPIQLQPQVVNTDQYLSDSTGWMKVTGKFTANGDEQFLTIGYFQDSTNIDDTLRLSQDQFVGQIVYYYIDGVELFETENEINLPNIFTPNNDNQNDLLRFNFPYNRVVIFNRWGQKVFENYDNAFWDGKTPEGRDVPDGTYYYLIETEEETYKGYIQLLR
jgi:gliding motility-associated-like protein